jgi:hypothetical protein
MLTVFVTTCLRPSNSPLDEVIVRSPTSSPVASSRTEMSQVRTMVWTPSAEVTVMSPSAVQATAVP